MNLKIVKPKYRPIKDLKMVNGRAYSLQTKTGRVDAVYTGGYAGDLHFFLIVSGCHGIMCRGHVLAAYLGKYVTKVHYVKDKS